MARGRKGNWLQRLNNRLIAMRAGRAVRRQRKAESDEREIKTEAERVLASLLLPMRLEEFDVALAALTGAGYRTLAVLHGLSDADLKELPNDLGIHNPRDRGRIMLASWLHAIGMEEFREPFVDAGVHSLERLMALRDDELKPVVKLMGQRRRLMRDIREDLATREDLVPDPPTRAKRARGATRAAREAAAEEDEVALAMARAAAAAEAEVRMQRAAAPKGAVGLGVLALDPRLREELKLAPRDGWHDAGRSAAGHGLMTLGPGASAESYQPRTPRVFNMKWGGEELVIC